MGIVSVVRLNLQKRRRGLIVSLSLPENGAKLLQRKQGGVLHCPLKVLLCTGYSMEGNELKRMICVFTLPLQRAKSSFT